MLNSAGLTLPVIETAISGLIIGAVPSCTPVLVNGLISPRVGRMVGHAGAVKRITVRTAVMRIGVVLAPFISVTTRLQSGH